MAYKPDLSDHTQWCFYLQIAGVAERWYSAIPPTGFGGVVDDYFYGTDNIPYVDVRRLEEVGDYAWRLDLAGGTVNYQPIDISISTEGRHALADDPFHTLSRTGEASAGWLAKLVEDPGHAGATIKVDRQPPVSWTYPKALDLDGECVRVGGVAGTGGEGDPYRFTNCKRGIGGTNARRHPIETILPSPTIMEHVAFWEGRNATLYAIEMRDDMRTASEWREVMVGVLAGPPVLDGKAFGLQLLPLTTLLDVEMGSTEEARSFGLVPHVRYMEEGRRTIVEVVVRVTQRLEGMIPELTAVDELYLYQHDFAGDGTTYVQWPEEGVVELNATWTAEEAAGAPMVVRIVNSGEEWTIETSEVESGVVAYELIAYSTLGITNVQNPETQAADLQAPFRQHLTYGLDLARPQDGYPRRHTIGGTEWTWTVRGSTLGVSQVIRGPATAFYENGDRVIVATEDVEVIDDHYPSVRIEYYDREAGEMAQVDVRITETAEVAVPGVGTVYELRPHLDDLQFIPSFGDWPGLPETKITPITVFREQDPATVMLQLLESGTGAMVNGTYDLNTVGAGIDARWIDEGSFLSVAVPDGAEEWTREVPHGVKVSETIESMLKATQSALAMRTGADGYSRITRIALGPASDGEVAQTITDADMGATEHDINDVDTRTFNRFEADIALEAGGESSVVIPDGRGIRRASGAAKTYDIDLRNARPFPEVDQIGQASTRLIPMAGAVFFALGSPRSIWKPPVPRSRLMFMAPGSVVSFTSERLRVGNSYGVTGATARLTAATIPMLRKIGSPDALASMEASHHPARLAGWNASAQVKAAPSVTSVTVGTRTFSLVTDPNGDAGLDITGFQVGDEVHIQPKGDQDNAVVTTITAIDVDTSTMTFADEHGLSGPDWGVVVPPVYASASEHHKGGAYYCDEDGLLGADDDPGVVLG